MLLIAILLPTYSILVLSLFIYGRKRMGIRHPWWLSLIHALFLFITFVAEEMVIKSIRYKYAKRTPGVLKLLNQIGLKYHIAFGTVLFAYRNNNFADDDLDICMFRDDYNKSVLGQLETIGFKLIEQWSLDGELCEQTFVNKKLGVSMDIFYISRGEIFAPTFDEKNNRYSRRPKNFKYEVEKTSLCGIDLYAPKNIEDYLEWNYGDWKSPDPNFHWLYGSSSEPNIMVNNANIEYKKF